MIEIVTKSGQRYQTTFKIELRGSTLVSKNLRKEIFNIPLTNLSYIHEIPTIIKKTHEKEVIKQRLEPNVEPSVGPSEEANMGPSVEPSEGPSEEPSVEPSGEPSEEPNMGPSEEPNMGPSEEPSEGPSGV